MCVQINFTRIVGWYKEKSISCTGNTNCTKVFILRISSSEGTKLYLFINDYYESKVNILSACKCRLETRTISETLYKSFYKYERHFIFAACKEVVLHSVFYFTFYFCEASFSFPFILLNGR